jgi:hypothetical protein
LLTLLLLTSIFYRDAVGKCPACTAADNCGYCLSTLQCLEGTESGPLNQSPCPSWSFQETGCPGIDNFTLIFLDLLLLSVVPNCEDYVECGTCAKMDSCAWCASENVCTTISKAFSKDCSGLVFELPCPDSYITGAGIYLCWVF